MNRRALAAIAALALAMFALAACGDDDSSSSTTAAETTSSSTEAASTEASGGGGGETIDIAADPNGDLAFTQTDLTAAAGSDTIAFENQSTTAHNVEVEDADGNDVAETDTITGDSAETTADLEPGTYTFYCGIPGHREAGMEGTITVK